MRARSTPFRSVLAVFLLLAPPEAASPQTRPDGVRTSIGAGFRVDPNLTEAIAAIVQGPDGRVWLGTEFGLYVYDGYEAEAFRGERGSAEPFPPGAVRALLLDGRDRLWVGHGTGLVLIDPIEGRVEKIYRHDPADPRSLGAGEVTSLHEDREGRLWVGVLSWALPEAGGLHRLDETSGAFRRFTHDPADPVSLSHNRVRTILEDSGGSVWVGTWGGLNRLRPGTDRFVRYLHDPADPTSLAYDDVKQLYEDASGTLWVATIGGGLDRYDPETDAFVHVPSPGSDYLTSVLGDETGRLWVTTLDDGLFVLRPETRALERLHLGDDPDRGPPLSTLAITADRVLWVAGLASEYGVGRTWRLDLEAPELTVRTLGPVRAVREGRGGEIWMGNGQRLLRWDRRTDELGSFACPGAGPPNDQHWLSSIVVDPEGTVWFGYWDPGSGLCRLAPGEATPRRVRPAGAGLRALDWISDMAWSDGRLWIVSAGRLVALDPASGELAVIDPASGDARASPHPAVQRVTADAEGDLWYATADGRLLRRGAGGGEIESFDGAAVRRAAAGAAPVTSLRPGRRGTIWIVAAGAGACAFDPESGECRPASQGADGRSDERMMDVIEDGAGRMWVVSVADITEVDPETGLLRTLPKPPSAGASRFSRGAAEAGADGDLYFGTSSGILTFRGAGAAGNPRPPATRITGAETIGDGGVEVTRVGGAAAEELELPSGRGDVTVRYAALHYADPEANRYEYRLDGLDEAWRSAGGERRARYTNLSAGSYLFRVRAASANGVWGDEAIFGFRILAPWWRQGWALALWTALALAGGIAVATVARRRRAFAARLADERREARRSRELAGAKSRLFADLAHEFRTPLALILGQIRAVREGSEAGTDRLDMAARQTRELRRLTDEMLELSRLEAGALDLDLRLRDLVPLIRGCVADFERAAEDAGVSLRLETPDQAIRASFDADRMRRITSNLLSNALKYTPEGGAVVVRVRAPAGAGSSGVVPARAHPSGGEPEQRDAGTERDDAILISVEDTGVGIPAETLDHVFDRFYRVPGARRSAVRGTGIGLALVRELVELHGGTISVASGDGTGTRFDIRLPPPPLAEAAPDRTERGAAEPAEPVGPAGPATNGRGAEKSLVLVVEDHADMRAFLRQELAEAHEVVEAADGATGLERATELVPDLVITDVMMPELDGYELVRRLRQDERTSHIPIVMLTGRTSEESRIAGLESGVDEYLAKPFSARVLRSRVDNLLELRRLLRSRYAGEIWLRPEDVEAPSIDQKFLGRVAEIIEERMSDRAFSVEELASAVHMSRSQLHRKLTALLGKSPGSLIRGMRLERAAGLIRSGSRTLGQIAYETGFSDQAHFSRSFKRHFGCPPSEWVEQPTD